MENLFRKGNELMNYYIRENFEKFHVELFNSNHELVYSHDDYGPVASYIIGVLGLESQLNAMYADYKDHYDNHNCHDYVDPMRGNDGKT